MFCHNRSTQCLLAIGYDGPCKGKISLLHQAWPIPMHTDAVWFVGSPVFVLPRNVDCVARFVVGGMSLLLG